MHHRKHGSTMPWTGLVRFAGLAEFRVGTVYTRGHDPEEARRLLELLASTVFPTGFTIGHIERGALVYQRYEE